MKEAGLSRKVASLLTGGTMFTLVIPWVLFKLSSAVNLPASRLLPGWGVTALSAVIALAALAYMLWAAAAFWNLGRGTPAPWTPPVKLVVTGPFRYSRNPLMFAAALYYFSIGLFFSSAVTGLFMAAALLIPISVFIKAFEEPWLEKHFGQAYRDYRRNTSFIIPRPPSKGR